jgi:TRAP transporter TAXI family solute receptor
MRDRFFPERWGRRGFLAAGLSGLALTALPGVAAAQPVRFFRIGGGPPGGTLFTAAGWISAAISNPPGSPPCEKSGSCGVPGMIALAQSTDGGLANLRALREGTFDAAIAYADMAHDARLGKGAFASAGDFSNLRALAALAVESLHIVVRRGGPIRRIAELKGKRVAVGAEAVGPAALAELVLRLHGVSRGQYRALPLDPEAAANAFAEGGVDAMIFLARPPAGVARQVMEDHGGVLLPVSAAKAEEAIKADPFLAAVEIPGPAYGGAAVPTLGVAPVLLAREDLDADLVTAMSRALWLAMKSSDRRHPLDPATFDAAQIGRRGVPLHPAAQAFRDALLQESPATTAPESPTQPEK